MLMQTSPEALNALNALLDARLAEHYVAPPLPVAVELCISDAPAASRRFLLGAKIESVTPGVGPAQARLTLSHAVLHAMLDDPTRFDPRSAEAVALGGVRIDGSARLAAYWLQLLKRPSSVALAALARARSVAPSSLQNVAVHVASAHGDEALHAAIADTLDRSVPLVVRGLIDWPELQWSLADWRERERATVLRADPASGKPQTVADFIDAFSARDTNEPGASNYTEGCLLPPSWAPRFALPRLPRGLFGPAQLWFGHAPEGTLVTRLHCDLASSFLAQIHGRKRVRLYAPTQDTALYALDSFNTYRPCRVDAGAPDLARFPRFASAQGVDVILEPGELLVIPTGWFHCVWAIDPVLSISRFADDVITSAALRECDTV